MLTHKRDEVRLAAAALLAGKLGAERLEELMAWYRAADWYYFDVGCWLDRVLYAPPPLRGSFARQLATRLAVPTTNRAEIRWSA